MSRDNTTARRLPPEDIRPGQYVAIMHVVSEREAWPWETDGLAEGEHIVRRLRVPGKTGPPMQVAEVCLPFVLVRTARGPCRMLDVRRIRLALVSPQFGEFIFEQVKARKKEAAREEAEKT